MHPATKISSSCPPRLRSASLSVICSVSSTFKLAARPPGRHTARLRAQQEPQQERESGPPAPFEISSTSAPPLSARFLFPLPKSLPHNYCATTHQHLRCSRYQTLSNPSTHAFILPTRHCGCPFTARLNGQSLHRLSVAPVCRHPWRLCAPLSVRRGTVRADGR